jgi:hypothetical protein
MKFGSKIGNSVEKAEFFERESQTSDELGAEQRENWGCGSGEPQLAKDQADIWAHGWFSRRTVASSKQQHWWFSEDPT